MQVDIWGESLWIPLHCITFNAPELIEDNKQIEYKQLFKIIGLLLPCKYCRNSYIVFTHFFPLKYYCKDRKGLVYWLYMIHKCVNWKLGKSNSSFSDVVYKYENYRAKCTNNTCSTKDDLNNSDIALFIKQTEDKYKKNSDTIFDIMIKIVTYFNHDYEYIITKLSKR